MALTFSRRRFVTSLSGAGVGVATFGLAACLDARTVSAAPLTVSALPKLPIAPRVAFSLSDGGKKRPSVDDAFLEEQFDNAETLFGTFGVHFSRDSPIDLDTKFLALETRADRDALAAELASGVVNVFFVDSLRDVDNPDRYRMGVTWRKLTDLKKKYIVVAQSAKPTTMAHELGHFFGLDHTSVKNNLMSYDRDGGTVFLDEKQGRTLRQHAEALYRTKQLVPRDTGGENGS